MIRVFTTATCFSHRLHHDRSDFPACSSHKVSQRRNKGSSHVLEETSRFARTSPPEFGRPSIFKFRRQDEVCPRATWQRNTRLVEIFNRAKRRNDEIPWKNKRIVWEIFGKQATTHSRGGGHITRHKGRPLCPRGFSPPPSPRRFYPFLFLFPFFFFVVRSSRGPRAL